MSTAKKISACTLLCMIATPFLFFVSMLGKQQWIEHEMKEKLETAALQTTSLPINEISWVKAEKEVLISGQLFDVKSYSVANGNITLVGLFDEQEKDLSAMMKNIMDQRNRENPLGQLAMKFFLSQYFHDPLHTSCQDIEQQVSKQFLPFTVTFPNRSFSIVGPPPRWLL